MLYLAKKVGIYFSSQVVDAVNLSRQSKAIVHGLENDPMPLC